MNRQDLIEALQTQLDGRVWQIIRNQSKFSFIFGSNMAIPWPVVLQTDKQYAQRCVEFVAQLRDTFYIIDSPSQPTPQKAERMVESALQSRNTELEAQLDKIKEAWTVIRDLVEADGND